MTRLSKTLLETVELLKEVNECYTEVPTRMLAAIENAAEIADVADTLANTVLVAHKDLDLCEDDEPVIRDGVATFPLRLYPVYAKGQGPSCDGPLPPAPSRAEPGARCGGGKE